MTVLKVHSIERLLSAEDAGIARHLLDLLLARLPKEVEAAARLGGAEMLEARLARGRWSLDVGESLRYDVTLTIQGVQYSLGTLVAPAHVYGNAAELLGLVRHVESTWDTISYGRSL